MKVNHYYTFQNFHETINHMLIIIYKYIIFISLNHCEKKLTIQKIITFLSLMDSNLFKITIFYQVLHLTFFMIL